MTVGSLEFLLLLLVASAVFPFVPGVRPRQILLAAFNVGFLYLLIPNVDSWAVLGVFILSGFLAGIAFRAWPNRLGLLCYLIILVGVFLFLKKYGFLEYLLPAWLLTHPITIVGLSYTLFRQIHFVVDCMQGQVSRVSLWDYANYQFNLFAILAGPIQRYQDFVESWQKLEPLPRDLHELCKTWMRVFWGVFKVTGLGVALFFAYDKAHGRLLESDAVRGLPAGKVLLYFGTMFYLYPIYMYVNFSGYCDTAIASASLLGLRLPENFHKPYLSRNMIDFWTRWHRTLGFWIRDYLFIPVYKPVAERKPMIAPSFAYVAYFIAFVAAGVWHGTTLNFLVFGVIHGIGASAAKWWENCLVWYGGRVYLKRYLQSSPIRTMAIIVTLHYFGVSMYFFADRLDRCVLILHAAYRAIAAGPGG